MSRVAKLIMAARVAQALLAIAKASASRRFLRSPTASAPPYDGGRVAVHVLIPLLHEAPRVQRLLDGWEQLLAAHDELVLVVLTTAREEVDRVAGTSGTRGALVADGRLAAWTEAGRARQLHYPRFNRTYGEQVRWGVEQVRQTCASADYVLLVNADSRIDDEGIRQLLGAVHQGYACVQQSAVFLANFAHLNPVPAAEALLQSTWTVETELFRYLAGSGTIRWLPQRVQSIWYQHSVGHGLLISMDLLDLIGGLPNPDIGLEDSALGYLIRSHGERVRPLRRLELADAPSSVRALLRQRATWVRGPIGALWYGPTSRRERLLVAQALYDGARWAFMLPAICVEMILLGPRGRRLRALVFVLRRYTTLALMLGSLPELTDYGVEKPPVRKLAVALLVYPVAVLSYGAGGLRGAIEIVREWKTGRLRIQPKTDA
ncbi:MAG TPA: glycosyltransferase family 2 protein [Solirubrobacteraceae bacterium]|jgi:cellulose synthase/poly-beta-1,6-N-acetylglucosamine synthase-like glycosyltransferase